jgi:hypothetical protein
VLTPARSEPANQVRTAALTRSPAARGWPCPFRGRSRRPERPTISDIIAFPSLARSSSEGVGPGRNSAKMAQSNSHLGELRLLLEELCCDLCRFEHVTRDGLAPEAVRIDREYWLGAPGAFADIRVAPASRPPYFVEVKFGYPADMLVRHLARKYSAHASRGPTASKVVLVVVLLEGAVPDHQQRRHAVPICWR